MLTELRPPVFAPRHRLHTNPLPQAGPGNQQLGAWEDAAGLILPAAAGRHALFELHHGLRKPMVVQFAPRDCGQGADHSRGQNAAGAQPRADRQAYSAANLEAAAQRSQSLTERLPLKWKAVQPERRARNRKDTPGPARLQQIPVAAILGDFRNAVRAAADHRLADAPDLRLNRILPVDLQRAIQHRAAPIETERRRIAPAAAQIDARRRGDVNAVEAPRGRRLVRIAGCSRAHRLLNAGEGLSLGLLSLTLKARAAQQARRLHQVAGRVSQIIGVVEA